jgi:hypothetical protein
MKIFELFTLGSFARLYCAKGVTERSSVVRAELRTKVKE